VLYQTTDDLSSYDDHIGPLVSVISQLMTKLDSQQEQLNLFQSEVASAAEVVSPSPPLKLQEVLSFCNFYISE
jgi:predicted XRE-type DNA-binding protein